jgi:hypothetical protein
MKSLQTEIQKPKKLNGFKYKQYIFVVNNGQAFIDSWVKFAN